MKTAIGVLRDTGVRGDVFRRDARVFQGVSLGKIPVMLGSGGFIPGFEEQLVGVNAGDTVVIKATFPEGYSAKELAGKAATFNTTVKSVEAPGDVKVEKLHEFEATKGGKPLEPYAGKSAGTVTFSQPGDYVLHITLNDFSEKGGGATACCWTTHMVKVTVK